MFEYRPTFIYWLIDTRPETIAAGWSAGLPFYCGKTVHAPETRFKGHLHLARKKPARRLSLRLAACGEHVRVQTMEIVPPGDGWMERERRWIKILRFGFPGTLNVNDGGEQRQEVIPIYIGQKEALRLRAKRLRKREQRKIESRKQSKAVMRIKREQIIALRRAERAQRNNKLKFKTPQLDGTSLNNLQDGITS
jgi:hypothetical protein